ncbi:Heat-labile enterotoxin, A chain [Metarhizium guizhouense ARSEF 977]|uniref:Heat-labile enterotoxin, A chain n=1 Tax=Metarhizium guizhouense (strain ARSEF 977) TaxID=1276136 RepID=A0A0B4GNP3_METGA|nr:Heat-labile enterotoxin, A chain [Metarhizium guizhouense ARSEF 977]
MRFKHFLAIFGSALIAAAYSTPGAYERLLYYYAYKLDNMGGGKTIAGGCKPRGVCSFDEFVHFIEGRGASEATVKITAEEFPPIEPTVELLVKAGKTGTIAESRIISNAKDYPDLFKKLGTNLSGILQKTQGFEHGTLKGQALEDTLREVRANIVLSMKRVFDGRVRATIDSFKPYADLKVVTNGATAIDFDKTVAENEGGITKEKLQELWDQHLDGRQATEKIVAEFKPLADYTPTIRENAEGQIDLRETFRTAVEENPWMKASWFRNKHIKSVEGNHQTNIQELRTAIASIEPIVCARGEARKREVARLDKRQGVNACFPWETPEIKEIIDLPPVAEGSEGVIDPEILATGRFAERANRANQVSSSEFEKAIGERLPKIPDSWLKNGVKTFNEVREQIGYKPMEPTSSDLVPGRGGKLSGAFGKLAGAAGGALWVNGIVQSFRTDSTDLDKAAAFTAIIPFVGCGVTTAAGAEKGHNIDLVTIDAVLCGIADVLLFGPLAPFGFALHFVRAVMAFFPHPPEPPSLEEMQERRDDSWTEVLKKVYESVYSHSRTDPTQSFAAKLESVFVIDTVSVLSEAAGRIGALNASGSPDLFHSSALGEGETVDLAALEKGTLQAIHKIRADRWNVVPRRQREFLLDIPLEFANGTAFSLSELAKKVNDEFIEHINSENFIKNYRDQSVLDDLFDAPMSGPSLKPNDHYSRARAKMKEVGGRLKESLPPLPQALNVAFVLGQSKGMRFAQNETLNLRSYFNTEIKEASTEDIPDLYRDFILIRQTHQTALFLQGRLKEEELDDSVFPVDNPDLLKGLRLLAAMKIGKIYEDEKVEALDKVYGRDDMGRHPTAPPEFTNLYIPPIPALKSRNHKLLVTLAIGLLEVVRDSQLNDDVTQHLRDGVSEIRLKNWEAMQQKIKKMQEVVKKISQRQVTGPPTPEEFLNKHMKSCVEENGSRTEICKFVVEGCYYVEDTSDEFASDCIRGAFLPDREARQKIRDRQEELCKKYPSRRRCAHVMVACARGKPLARFEVVWACADKAISKTDGADAAAASGSTS